MTFKDITRGTVHPALQHLFDTLGNGGLHRVQCGIYDDCGFNFHNQVDMRGWEHFVEHAGVPCYGVADSIEQFLELYASKIVLDPRGCCVGFTTVTKAEQSPSGGWRWHKWGGYVGKHTPQYEYLYNEPDIESVVTFSVLWEKL